MEHIYFDSTMVLKHRLLMLHITPAGWQRSLIADYGVPLLVILWTALSYTLPSKIPSGVPRRLFTPLPWEPKSLQHWTVAKVIRKFITMIQGFSYSSLSVEYFYGYSTCFIDELAGSFYCPSSIYSSGYCACCDGCRALFL